MLKNPNNDKSNKNAINNNSDNNNDNNNDDDDDDNNNNNNNKNNNNNNNNNNSYNNNNNKMQRQIHNNQYRAPSDIIQRPKTANEYHKKLHLRCCVDPMCASETAYSSLNVMNKGRPCRLNSFLGTLTCNGNFNKHDCNNNSNNVITRLK